MSNLRSIAESVGVSIRTVSRSLNASGYVKAELRERILAEAQAQGYRRNTAGVSLRTGVSQEVVVVLDGLSGLHLGKVAGMEKPLHEGGYPLSLLMRTADAAGAGTCELLAEMGHRRPAAVAIFNGPAYDVPRIVTQLGEQGAQYVLFDNSNIGPAGAEFDEVKIDRAGGVRESIHYLAGRGCRRIAYLALGVLRNKANRDRLEGYRGAIEELGLEPMYLETPGPGLLFDRARRLGRAVGAGRGPMPDAVQAHSDKLALGFLAGLHDAGVRVPDDVAVVGLDDCDGAATSWPPLTTVAQPTWQVGEKAAEILLRKLRGEQREPGGWSVTVAPKLIVRETA
jgi:LacI family transcriptional regulator